VISIDDVHHLAPVQSAMSIPYFGSAASILLRMPSPGRYEPNLRRLRIARADIFQDRKHACPCSSGMITAQERRYSSKVIVAMLRGTNWNVGSSNEKNAAIPRPLASRTRRMRQLKPTKVAHDNSIRSSACFPYADLDQFPSRLRDACSQNLQTLQCVDRAIVERNHPPLVRTI